MRSDNDFLLNEFAAGFKPVAFWRLVICTHPVI